MICLNCEQLNVELIQRCNNVSNKLIKFIVNQNRDMNKKYVFSAFIRFLLCILIHLDNCKRHCFRLIYQQDLTDNDLPIFSACLYFVIQIFCTKKLVRSESLKWCHKLRRSHSKMELYNIYSHKMAINTHYIQERTTVLYSQSKEKLKKKIEKKNFEKKS